MLIYIYKIQNEPINSQGTNDSEGFAIWKIENFPDSPELIFFTHNLQLFSSQKLCF